MLFTLTSFLAGLLTILAPCVLPLLPIIVGSSVSGDNKLKPYFVILGLAISVVVFTLLLRASTILIDVDPSVWSNISGGILIIFGLVYVFPGLWDKISSLLKLSSSSDKLLEKANQKGGYLGDMLIGGALGPVFTSCSPTYAVIVATVLPANFVEGLWYTIVYALGLAVIMLAISLLGRKLIVKLNILANPNGWFKRILGYIFVAVGIAVILGLDKTLETELLKSGYLDGLLEFEEGLVD